MMNVDSQPKATNWSLERGYRSGSNLSVYPIRVFSAKQSMALVIFLRLFDRDLEYVCRSLVPGFKIFLHTPGEIPAMSRKSYRVPAFQEAELSINPTYITTANGLRSYKPNQRQCFFNNERQLRFFKIYAQTNCEAECLANFTENQCGCVQFSMPSKRKMNWQWMTLIQWKKFIYRVKSYENLRSRTYRLLSKGRKAIVWWGCDRRCKRWFG